MIQNSNSSIILQLLKVMQSKAHKNCPNITFFALYAIFENADRELEFEEAREGKGMEGKISTCCNRCCASTQKDLSGVIREELLIKSVTICLES